MAREIIENKASSKKRAEFRNNPDELYFGNDGNQTEGREKSDRIKSPWIILIERMSENGYRTIETTTKTGLESSLTDYLSIEALNLAARAEEIREALREAYKPASHGRERTKREVRDIRVSQNKELNKVLEHKGVLLGERKEPIKIIVAQNGEVSDWKFPSGEDAYWVQFIRGEKPEIINLSQDDISLIHKGFLLRLGIMQDQSRAVQVWQTFIREEIGERRDLDEYLVALTNRFKKD